MTKQEVLVGEQVSIFEMQDTFKKSNYLIDSKFKMHLTDYKIFNLSLIKVKFNEDAKRPIAEINMQDALKMLNRKKSPSIYGEMKDIADRLTDMKKILIEDISDPNDKKFKMMRLLNVVEYTGNKMIFKFEQDAKDLIMCLSSNASSLAGYSFSKFKSYYSVRLYETLKRQFESSSIDDKPMEFIYDLNELKYEMCAIELDANSKNYVSKGKMSLKAAIDLSVENCNEFKKYAVFKRIIDKSVKEINKYTNLDVEYKGIRTGKGGKTTQIKFTIKNKNKKNSENMSDKDNYIETIDDKEKNVDVLNEDLFKKIDDLSDIISEKLKMSDYKTLLETANYDLDVIKEKYSIAKSSTSEIKNLVGWLVKAIKTDYKSPVAMDKEAKEEKSNVKKESQPKGQPKGLHFEGERQRTREEYDEIEKRCLAR